MKQQYVLHSVLFYKLLCKIIILLSRNSIFFCSDNLRRNVLACDNLQMAEDVLQNQTEAG